MTCQLMYLNWIVIAVFLLLMLLMVCLGNAFRNDERIQIQFSFPYETLLACGTYCVIKLI